MAKSDAGSVVVPIRVEVTGSPLDPRIELFSADGPMGLVKVDVQVDGDTATYRTPDGEVLGRLTLDQHIACPTCGQNLPGEVERIDGTDGERR